MSLGQRIRARRQAAGLTQAELGGAEFTKSFISLVERDRANPSVDSLRILASRLGTSVDALLGAQGALHEAAAQNLLGLSQDAIRRRDFDTADRLLEMVGYLAHRFALPEARAEMLLLGARMALERGESERAWSLLQDAQTAAESRGDDWRRGRALVLMGQLRLRSGAFPQAAALLREGLATLRNAHGGRDPERTEALIALGTCLVYMGRVDQGARRYQEALRSTAAQRSLVLRGQALWGLGWAHRRLGNRAQARELLLEAKACMERAEELPDLMRVLHNLGQVLLEEGRPADALRHFHHALRVMDRLGKPDRAAILTEIARGHLAEGRLADALAFGERALQSAREVHDPVEQAEAQLLLARLYALTGRVRKAVALLKEALPTFRERGMEARAADVGRELGLLLRSQGAHAPAAALLALAAEARDGTAASGSDAARRS